jgi:NAD-dependent DNA ligase
MKLTKKQITELEKVIRHLDTAYDTGEDCMLPPDAATWILDEFGLDEDEVVPDLRYDALKRNLPADSKLWKTPTGAALTGLKKITLSRPMVSIDKACHEKRPIQEQMLFKWMADCLKDIPGKGPVFDLDEKDVPEVDLKTRKPTGQTHHWTKREFGGKVVVYPKNYFSMSLKLDGSAVLIHYEKGELQYAVRRPRDGIHGDDITEQIKQVAGVPTKLSHRIFCRRTQKNQPSLIQRSAIERAIFIC